MDYLNIVRTIYKVSDFVSWQRSGSLVLSPSFQRRSVWSKAAKSFLIDTIIRGLPIPIIFLRERTDLRTLEPIREVVDGQQRLRTIFSFIEPKLLKDFDSSKDDFTVQKSHNPEISFTRFNDLDPKLRHTILNYEFSVHVLPSDTEDREVLQIFARMNSTGVKLNRQELRNAQYFGAFKRIAYSLAYEQLNRWRDWNIFSESDIARMIEVEETSDFIRLILDGIHGMSQPALDNLYKKYEDDFPYELEISRRFRFVMDRIAENVGGKLKSLVFSRKALFNTLFSFYYELIFGLGSSPDVKLKQKPIPQNISDIIYIASEKIRSEKLSEELARVLRGGTGNLESRKVRLEFLQGIYKGD